VKGRGGRIVAARPTAAEIAGTALGGGLAAVQRLPMSKSDDANAETENPLDAFLLEAQTAPPPPRRTASATVTPIAVHGGASSRAATEIAGVSDVRVLAHVTKESADIRRRVIELRLAIDETTATQTTEIRRAARIITVAIAALLVFGFAQLFLAIWITLR
jgi:hypothetical protein